MFNKRLRIAFRDTNGELNKYFFTYYNSPSFSHSTSRSQNECEDSDFPPDTDSDILVRLHANGSGVENLIKKGSVAWQSHNHFSSRTGHKTGFLCPTRYGHPREASGVYNVNLLSNHPLHTATKRKPNQIKCAIFNYGGSHYEQIDKQPLEKVEFKYLWPPVKQKSDKYSDSPQKPILTRNLELLLKLINTIRVCTVNYIKIDNRSIQCLPRKSWKNIIVHEAVLKITLYSLLKETPIET